MPKGRFPYTGGGFQRLGLVIDKRPQGPRKAIGNRFPPVHGCNRWPKRCIDRRAHSKRALINTIVGGFVACVLVIPSPHKCDSPHTVAISTVFSSFWLDLDSFSSFRLVLNRFSSFWQFLISFNSFCTVLDSLNCFSTVSVPFKLSTL